MTPTSESVGLNGTNRHDLVSSVARNPFANAPQITRPIMASSLAPIDGALFTVDAEPSGSVTGCSLIEPANSGLVNHETDLLNCIQNASVHTLEVNFFFPFSLVDTSLTASSPSLPAKPLPSARSSMHGGKQSASASFFSSLTNQGERDKYAPQFGDDGHLLFKECLKTIEVEEVRSHHISYSFC